MEDDSLSPRLRRLPRTEVLGFEVPVAAGRGARLLGLAGLDRPTAGAGLLIPRCSSVHTFGMRFHLDLVFLDRRGEPLAVHFLVPARRVVSCRRAAAVLELPAAPARPRLCIVGGQRSGIVGGRRPGGRTWPAR